MLRVLAAFLAGGVLCSVTAAADGQSATAYTDLLYPSGGLRIQAYLYRPDGEGPFPVVIYNHGSRVGRERQSLPFEHIGALLSQAGYAVLIPERRGYGRSDGLTWTEDAGNDRRRFVARLQEEADDVLAAVDYLRTVPSLDPNRVGVMGWSFGGIVTMFAVSRSAAFAVAVNQAGGALAWNGSAELRTALIAAAEHATTPTLLMVAENDRTTASITTLGEIFKKRGMAHRMVIYEPFRPQRQTFASAAPGHQLFSAQGINVWQRDVLEFLARYLGGPSPPTSQR